jgi:aspartate aminotransferase
MTTTARIGLSRRVSRIKPSTTLAVGQKAGELKAAGVDVLSFAAGEPDFDTPVKVREAAKRAIDNGETHYAPVPGDPKTRAVIAEKFAKENGIPDITPNHVVVSHGGKQSLYLAFHALLDHPGEAGQAGGGSNIAGTAAGGEVVVPVPAWVSYQPQIEMAGGVMVELNTTPQSDFKITPEQLDAAINERTRIVLLNSPSNPCGTMYSEDELRALAGVIERAAASRAPELMVISDEIYERLTFGGRKHFSIGSVPEIAHRVITINGLSKTYAMTGWRVGFLGASGDTGLALAKACNTMQSQLNSSIPQFILPAIRVALTECAGDVEHMRRTFEQRAAAAYERVKELPGVICPEPTGAFYLFCDVSAHFGKTSAKGSEIGGALDFAAALLEEHHMAVVPGNDFGGCGPDCIRLTYACDEASIAAGIDRLGEFISGLR